MIEAKFTLRPRRCWAQELSEKFPRMRMVVFSTQQEKGLSRWVASGEELQRALEFSKGNKYISSIEVLSRSKEGAIVQTVCRCPIKSQVHHIISRHGCFYSLPDPIVTYGGGKHYRIIAPGNDALHETLAELKRIGSLQLEAVVEYKDRRESFFVNVKEISDALTEKQKRSLKSAYHAGYFTIPKKTTIQKLARRIGIAESTLQEQIAEAERKIISFVADYI
jgi:predicted DNA binding protein